jgi:hypothetical protein
MSDSDVVKERASLCYERQLKFRQARQTVIAAIYFVGGSILDGQVMILKRLERNDTVGKIAEYKDE